MGEDSAPTSVITDILYFEILRDTKFNFGMFYQFLRACLSGQHPTNVSCPLGKRISRGHSQRDPVLLSLRWSISLKFHNIVKSIRIRSRCILKKLALFTVIC